MLETLADTLPPPLRHQRFPQLETDLFCQTCGYNLHGQPVSRDERLGILICRCSPRPRQYLAFLWRADGRTPPAATFK